MYRRGTDGKEGRTIVDERETHLMSAGSVGCLTSEVRRKDVRHRITASRPQDRVRDVGG